MAKVNMMQLNEDPPPANIGKFRAGYGLDGVSVYVNVNLEPNTAVCRQCEGTGRLHFVNAVNGFERHESCECENCDGYGVVYSETTEDE
jgi:hypothetical protein